MASRDGAQKDSAREQCTQGGQFDVSEPKEQDGSEGEDEAEGDGADSAGSGKAGGCHDARPGRRRFRHVKR
jgi:hypothetical protein